MNSFKGIFDLTGLRQKYKASGEGVKVAILDTGIDFSNPFLKRHIVSIRDVCNPGKGTGQDTDGHGTLLAGIITSVAPSCELLIEKIMLRSGFYTQDALSDGIRWAIRHGAELICIASGDRYFDTQTDDAVRQAVLEKNVLVLAAIGNDGERSNHAGTYPARCKECIAIGAVDDTELITSFCDINPDVPMVCAPGVEIYSFGLNGSITPDSGTSQSAAYATGVLALLVSGLKKNNKHLSAVEIREAIFQTALDKVSGELAYKLLYTEELLKSFL